MDYQTIQVRIEEPILYLTLYRPDANNTINSQLVRECQAALTDYSKLCSVVVLEGLPEVFCFGADFHAMEREMVSGLKGESVQNPEPMYDLWSQLACGAYITIAHVRGKTNAGGIGFVSACDIVLADETATFSLSELLFGLFPACVLPFLVRRIGFQKAHYMTLLNKPISAKQAVEWGLVDACERDSQSLLRKHLLRLRRISKTSIKKYKEYMHSLNDGLIQSKGKAIAANLELFSDIEIRENISRYVQTGQFPWEQ